MEKPKPIPLRDLPLDTLKDMVVVVDEQLDFLHKKRELVVAELRTIDHQLETRTSHKLEIFEALGHHVAQEHSSK